jgi:capsular polysaccharide biosynthesis protein/Mrp family chromosome partitioning ATPase
MSIETQNTGPAEAGFRKPPSTIFDVIGVLTRRWWLIALLTFVGLAVAFVYTVRQEKVYEADATTLVQRQSLAKSLNNIVDPGAQVNEGPRVLEAQAKLAISPVVAAATLKAVPGTGLDVNELLDNVTVTPDVNGDLLDFALTNGDGDTAVKLVNAYVDQYVIYSTVVSKQLAVDAAADVRKQLKKLADDGQRDSQSYQKLNANLDSLRSIVSLSTPTAQVISKATDYDKVKPKLIIALVLGLALGLAIGLGMAFLLDALDGRVRSPQAIAEFLGLPLLAVMPASRRVAGPASGGRHDPASEEACRVLLAAIEGVERGKPGGSLLVTGVSNPATYSSIAANLAYTAARAGRDTVLIDVGFRNASLTKLMGVKGHVGASDLLLGDAALADASLPLSPSSAEEAGLAGRLRFIPIGSRSGDSADLIGSRAVKELIERLASGETLVVVDAGATLDTSEAISTAGFVDHVLFVAATDDAKHEPLAEASRRLELTAASPIGVAVIDVTD